MIATDDDGRFQLTRFHHFIKRQTCQMPLSQAEPADARRKTLERDTLASHFKPAMDTAIFRKELLHLFVGLVNVVGVSRKSHPAKWALAFTEQRPDIGRYESGKIERVLHSLLKRHLPDIVAVVDRRHAHLMEIQHGPDV